MWIEVVYALSKRQVLLQVELPENTSIFDGAKLSGIEAMFPGLEITETNLGIFGRKSKNPRTEMLKEGDRIEIYRPLLIDPKQARRNRTQKTAGSG